MTKRLELGHHQYFLVGPYVCFFIYESWSVNCAGILSVNCAGIWSVYCSLIMTALICLNMHNTERAELGWNP